MGRIRNSFGPSCQTTLGGLTTSANYFNVKSFSIIAAM